MLQNEAIPPPMKKGATRKAQVFDAEAFGKAVKEKRTSLNYSIRDVSAVLEIPNSTISRMERALPSEMKSVLLVCDWLGRSVCDFIKLEKKPQFEAIV